MATYNELRTRSQQVRDEVNIGGNTALRVGQLLMDMVEYFQGNDEAASQYLAEHFAMLNTETGGLAWQVAPIVILQTMGSPYDSGDYTTLSAGQNFYRTGYIQEADGGGGGINGERPRQDVLYVNFNTLKLYTWNGASFEQFPTGGGVVNNLNQVVTGAALDATQGKKLKDTVVALAALVIDALEKVAWIDDDGQDVLDDIQDIIDELTAPVIYTDLSSLSFATTTGTAVTKTIKVHGGNLTADISLSVSGTGFSIDKNSVGKNDGETIVTVTYNPSSTGTNTGSIVLSSTGATSVTVSLSGEAVAGPSIGVNVNSLSLSSVDGATVTNTFKVTPINLSNDISLSVSGTGFSIDKQTISKDAGETTVTVTYSPATSGTDTGTITIESVGVSSKTVSLSGTSSILTAVFSSAKQIYTSDTLDWLKQFVTVEDGGVAVSSWTLSGTLTVGTSTLTATYNNRSVQFTISNVLAGVASFYNFVNRAVFSYQFPETYVTGTNSIRAVYPGMDKHMPGGVSYTFIAECNYNTAQFGIVFYNQSILDAYEGSYAIVGTGNVWDSTWKSPGATFTPDASVNNSAIVGARIISRVDTNNSDIPNDFLIERVVLIQA